MKLLKSLLLLSLISICLFGCEQSETSPQFEEIMELISFDEDNTVQDLLNQFDRNEPNGREDWDFSSSFKIGRLNLEQIMKTHVDPNRSEAHYTIPIINDNTDNSEWLILEPTPNGYVGYVLQYEFTTSNMELKNLTGYLRILDLERNIQNAAKYENGIKVEQIRNSANARQDITIQLADCCNCGYEWVDAGTYDENGDGVPDGNLAVEVLHCDCSSCGESGADSDGNSNIGIGSPIDGGDSSYGGGGSGGTIGLPSNCNGSMVASDGSCIEESEFVYDLLTDDIRLNLSQKNKLREEFKKVHSIPINAKFLDELRNNGYSVKVNINPALSTPGGFYPSTNTISFRSLEDIDYNSVLEEYFHAFQHYRIGIGKYSFGDKKGASNIEFEAKLYNDIVSQANIDLLAEMGESFFFLGGSSNEYSTWINQVTSNHTKYPTWQSIKDDYYNYMQLFTQEKPIYDFPIDYDLQPTTMLYLFGL
ncbi:hypothetical protein [Ekhidna sp.]|uniref:hypothetical protein n=1 Tax=Ekhidna sp. TaxID=2608089 RepID=UPI00329A4876